MSGVYTLQLDSNLRGFKYEFLVLIEGNDNFEFKLRRNY